MKWTIIIETEAENMDEFNARYSGTDGVLIPGDEIVGITRVDEERNLNNK